MENIKKNFLEDGFFSVPGIISDEIKFSIEKEVFTFANMFRKKLSIPNDKIIDNINNLDDFNTLCIQLEEFNNNSLFALVSLISNLPSLKSVSIQKNIINLTANTFGLDEKEFLSQNGTFLVNIPNNKRILYHWHNAKNSYPKRCTYLNFWLPMLVDKNSKNGTMEVAIKSHHHEFPFLEFKTDSKSGTGLTQNLVPEEFVSKFEKKRLETKYGDLVAMHPNLLHSSCLNETDKCSFVLVFKIWHIGKDWTLSPNISQKYFSEDKFAFKEVKTI